MDRLAIQRAKDEVALMRNEVETSFPVPDFLESARTSGFRQNAFDSLNYAPRAMMTPTPRRQPDSPFNVYDSRRVLTPDPHRLMVTGPLPSASNFRTELFRQEEKLHWSPGPTPTASRAPSHADLELHDTRKMPIVSPHPLFDTEHAHLYQPLPSRLRPEDMYALRRSRLENEGHVTSQSSARDDVQLETDPYVYPPNPHNSRSIGVKVRQGVPTNSPMPYIDLSLHPPVSSATDLVAETPPPKTTKSIIGTPTAVVLEQVPAIGSLSSPRCPVFNFHSPYKSFQTTSWRTV